MTDGATHTNIYTTYTDGNVYGRINDDPASGSQGTPASIAGHWIANRSGPSASGIAALLSDHDPKKYAAQLEALAKARSAAEAAQPAAQQAETEAKKAQQEAKRLAEGAQIERAMLDQQRRQHAAAARESDENVSEVKACGPPQRQYV
jgi:hypothetical protein